MIANVDNKWVWLHHVTDHEDQILWESFSVSKPNLYISPDANVEWDGVYRKYNRAHKRIARPLLSMLRGVCKQHDLPLSIVDTREKWEYQLLDDSNITPALLPGIELAEYQLRAIRSCLSAECGIIDIPTGGGKGEIICGICKVIQCPTVILADQRIVVDQLKARLELRDVASEVGLFYAGSRPNGEMIIVGLIQSLTATKKPPKVPDRKQDESEKEYNKRLRKWDSQYAAFKTRLNNVKFLNSFIKKAEMIIVDECDKATSESYKSLFRHKFNGRRRYGFSGTPIDPDKPVEALVMQEHLGSIIFRESRENVMRYGRIIPTHYNMISIGNSPTEASAYDLAYTEHLIENDSFHKLVCGICLKYSGGGTLILVDRKDLGFALERVINENGLETHFIYGETPKKKREEALRRFEKREFKVLIGGKIINRGLDLDGGCETLIIAGGGKLQSDLIQKVGRALRRNSQGYSRIFDFYFRNNRYLYKHSKSRLVAMVNSGFQVTVVFRGGVIDGKELIEKRFRVARKYLDR